MAHESQERYSNLVMAKLREELILKDGVIFNNDYEGTPKAGIVQIPVRDTEVAVSDYDKLNGITLTNGSTGYEPFYITKDVAVNELIDNYDAEKVPDNLVADRLDSAGYSLARKLDKDGANTLLANGEKTYVANIDASSIYDAVVDVRTQMSKDNIPNDGKRYLLVTPDTYALMLKDTENFIRQGDLSQRIKETGALGQYAGFNVYAWNDTTANLVMIAGHPKYATRANDFKVPVHTQDLSGSGKYIGACAVQGRMAYDHKVLRSKAIKVIYGAALVNIAVANGSTTGTKKLTVTGTSGTLKYKVNPTDRAKLNDASYDGTALTSGTTEVTCKKGDVIEVVDIVSSKVAAVGYVTI